jgi:hypothetical protein
MASMRIAAVMVLLTAICICEADKKKPQQAYLYKPNQTIDLKSEDLATTSQHCESWAIATGLEAMLRQQNISLDRHFWLMRLYGGELCVQEMPSAESLARAVTDEFVLDDGRHVRLQLEFTPGAPREVDSLIAGMEQQKIALVILRGHAYYLAGATYDEHVGRDGSRLYEIKELRLANIYTNLPGTTFEKGRDDVGEIGGIVSVIAVLTP